MMLSDHTHKPTHHLGLTSLLPLTHDPLTPHNRPSPPAETSA
jgi:hypothetical protein